MFDVLGNAIATLVDEYKVAGKYEVEFNASSLPSGVYFYQLQAGNYIDKEDDIDEVTEKIFLFKPLSMKVGGGFLCSLFSFTTSKTTSVIFKCFNYNGLQRWVDAS